MANTQSAKKAIRSSAKKKEHNLFWKRRIAAALKTMAKLSKDKKADTELVNKNLSILQKILDKAAKESVIHKNKANRLKSRYTKKVAAHENTTKPETKSERRTKTSKSE